MLNIIKMAESSSLTTLFGDIAKWVIFVFSAGAAGCVAYLHKLGEDNRFNIRTFMVNMLVSMLIGLITQALIEGLYPDMNLKLQFASVLIIGISANKTLELLETRGSQLMGNFINKIEPEKNV